MTRASTPVTAQRVNPSLVCHNRIRCRQQIIFAICSKKIPRKGRLDHAALELAAIDTPGLEPEPWLDRLNELASQLGDRLRNFNDGRDFVETAQRYLFGELGFHGNEDDFFDPRNSCLDQVLERRVGIPITLSVMYMEIARRLAMPVFGISLPRHFVIQFDDGNYATYIDPFNGGRPITAAGMFCAGRRESGRSRLAAPRVEKRNRHPHAAKSARRLSAAQ